MEKKELPSVTLCLPKDFIDLVDELVKRYPDFKNRNGVIKYAVRRYYDEITDHKKEK